MPEKKKCSPCEINAALMVGDRVCHGLKSCDCHGLAKEVQAGRMSVHRYVDKLLEKAEKERNQPAEKSLKELKRLLNE